MAPYSPYRIETYQVDRKEIGESVIATASSRPPCTWTFKLVQGNEVFFSPCMRFREQEHAERSGRRFLRQLNSGHLQRRYRSQAHADKAIPVEFPSGGHEGHVTIEG